MNKKGFTIVELLAIISLLALIIVLIFPNIINSTEKSKISMKLSKIQAIETAAEKYGNNEINNFHNCVYGISNSELENKCSFPVKTLIANGYLTADKDNDILNPETNQPLDGNIFLCYDPAKINIYATYVEKDKTFACSDIDVKSGNYLTLSSSVENGYVGGEPISINIIKQGNFLNNGISCSSEDPSIAKCEIENQTLKVSIISPDFEEEMKTVKIEVTGKFGPSSEDELHQTLILNVYSSSLNLNEDSPTEMCMESGTSETITLYGKNIGELMISSTDSSILNGIVKSKNEISLESKENSGLASITITEKNGNKSITINKRVYNLKLLDQMPSDLLQYNEKTINVDFNGNDSITIKSKNPSVIQVAGPDGVYADTITLNSGTESFKIKAIGKGNSEISIISNPCTKQLNYNISVSSFYLEHNSATLYMGGSAFETKVIGGGTDNYTCVSQDPSVVSCEISGPNIKLIPKSNVKDNIAVTVYGSLGGSDEIMVDVKDTSINLVNEIGNSISKVCSDINVGYTEKVFVQTLNSDNYSIQSLSNEKLVNALISDRELILTNKSLDTNDELYKKGNNTGISKVIIKENNGNKTASLDYFIYDLKLENELVKMIVGDTQSINISSWATGNLSVISDKPEVVSAQIINPSYSYDVNAENKSTLKLEAKSTGTAILTIQGTDCGTAKISVEVTGQEYSITLLPGTFTASMGTNENTVFKCSDEDKSEDCVASIVTLTCVTKGNENSCEVSLPEIIPNGGFIPNGFSNTKDDKTKKHDTGDKIILSSSNNNNVLYANSIDNIKPICSIETPLYHIAPGKTSYINIRCIETGSGSNSILTPESFTISNPDAGNIASVEKPTELFNDSARVGYIYRVGIESNAFAQSFKVKLKANQVVDQFDNANDEVDIADIFVAEYRMTKYWYIGKDNQEDIIAMLYFNENLPSEITNGDSPDMYTLKIYGHGDIQDFQAGESGTNSPWIEEGYQTLISNIIMEDNITNISKNVFYNMFNLNRIKLSEKITTIESNAFSGDRSLKEIIIPSSVKSINNNAFNDCENLSIVKLNKGLQNIGSQAFMNTSIKELWIPNTVQNIGMSAFVSNEDNMQLEKLEFENGSPLTIINIDTFKNHKLKSVTIPAKVITISTSAFEQYSISESTLSELHFEENSQTRGIMDRAFYLTSLSSLELPDSIFSIGSNAFSILSPDVTSIRIGPNLSNLGTTAIAGYNIQEFVVDPANDNFTSENGVLYNKNKTELVRFPDRYDKKSSNFEIPNTVTTINEGAFGGVLDYETSINFTLNIPESVTEINYLTNFNGSKISEFNINNNKYISVDGIIYSKDQTQLLKIPNYYPKNQLIINSKVKELAAFCGYGNMKINKITIPESVTKIGHFSISSDPNIAYTSIYLNTTDDVVFSNSSFANAYILDTSEYIKNIYVNTTTLKNKIETLYEYISDELNVIIN